MSDSLHIVCPSCDAVNRVPAARLDDAARQLEPRIRLAKIDTEADPSWGRVSVFAAYRP